MRQNQPRERTGFKSSIRADAHRTQLGAIIVAMALREHIDRFLGKPKSVSRCPCEELAEIKNDWGLISALGHLGAGDFRLYRAHALERFPESRFPSWRLWKLSQRYQRLLSACYRLKVQQGEIEEDEELLREY